MTQQKTPSKPKRSARTTGKPQTADGTDRSRGDRAANRGATAKGKDAKAPATKQRLRLPIVKAAAAAAGVGAPGNTTRTNSSKAHCTACGLCCSYVAIETDGPATVKAATQLLWYIYHEGVSLYVNDDEWMVQFDTTCIYLQPDYRCGIYDTRPHICREFSEKDCEVNTGDDGLTFYNADEFLAHLKQSRPRVHAFVQKHFAPPPAAARTRKEPFEQRFAAVLARREAL